MLVNDHRVGVATDALVVMEKLLDRSCGYHLPREQVVAVE